MVSEEEYWEAKKKVQSIQFEGGIWMDADTSNNLWHQ